MKIFLSSLIVLLLCFLAFFFVGCYYNYFYPLKFEEEIAINAKLYNVSSALVASIINTESGFNKDAVSQKGALGLMQVMPSTAQWIAGVKNEDYSKQNLFNPQKNIEYGVFYFSYLNKYYNDIDLAICAYNAGMGNVNKWLADKEYSQDSKHLDKIPFKETRDYIIKVKKNIRYYKNKV